MRSSDKLKNLDDIIEEKIKKRQSKKKELLKQINEILNKSNKKTLLR